MQKYIITVLVRKINTIFYFFPLRNGFSAIRQTRKEEKPLVRRNGMFL